MGGVLGFSYENAFIERGIKPIWKREPMPSTTSNASTTHEGLANLASLKHP